MKIYKSIKMTYLFVLLISLLSCASTQQLVTDKAPEKPQAKLLFLNFEIVKLNDTKSVSIINQITADGQQKRNRNKDISGTIGDLECVLLDKDYNQLETYYIENPLHKIIEFINDSGDLEKKILDLDRSEFSLKLQQNPHAEYIIINEITTEGTIKLNNLKIE
ncbi:hypothetical protein [Winogradskyella wichelsiae]|uniref:hypothetical protein n=1 Tax=Winogradskyella wichelsiae TaxID=2697007 RepID=UPI003EFAAD0B